MRKYLLLGIYDTTLLKTMHDELDTAVNINDRGKGKEK